MDKKLDFTYRNSGKMQRLMMARHSDPKFLATQNEKKEAGR